ncbi:MAG: DUF3052 domain-containing protein [Rudaea sp.]
MSVTAGYSGTPLAKKLGIKAGSHVLLLNAPTQYLQLVAPLPPHVHFRARPNHEVDIVHVFATRRQDLEKRLAVLRKRLRPDAAVWVSWPKRAARMPTDITEGTIREVAFPLGFVDIKVCAVNETWSGLKVVVRRELR